MLILHVKYKQKFRFCGAPFIFLAVVSRTYCFCIWCEQKLPNNKDCTVLYTKLWGYQNSWLNYSSSITTNLASFEFMSAYKWKWELKTKHNCHIFNVLLANFWIFQFFPKTSLSFENNLKNWNISNLIAAWVPFSFSPIHMINMYTQPYFGRIKYIVRNAVYEYWLAKYTAHRTTKLPAGTVNTTVEFNHTNINENPIEPFKMACCTHMI